jgi:hypothetical protein
MEPVCIVWIYMNKEHSEDGDAPEKEPASPPRGGLGAKRRVAKRISLLREICSFERQIEVTA